jgi:hypothetical protein
MFLLQLGSLSFDDTTANITNINTATNAIIKIILSLTLPDKTQHAK